MVVVVQYVNGKGHVIEHFLGVEHVTDTSAVTLKATIDDFFCRNGLGISRLRGQCYDGASNMRGQFGGLKTLILNENPYAYYIHCFAHQLQLALVAVAMKHDHVSSLFDFTARVLNVVGSSCKRRDMLREKQAEKISKTLQIGEILSGQGLNQETNLQRPDDTRWGSHYNTLLSLTNMFASVIDVLEVIGSDALNTSHLTEAQDITDRLLSFEFVFSLFLMRKVLTITNELSQALQRKDQDIVNAMNLVKVSKIQLRDMRKSGWSSLLEDVSFFCNKHGIEVPDMDVIYVTRGRRRRNVEELTNLHHYRVETLFTILDLQLEELNDRFSDSDTELLMCVNSSLPSNSFSHFDKKRLLQLAEYYPKDFSQFDTWKLSDQLDTYIVDMHLSNDFANLNGIGELASKMVEIGRNNVYPLVYLLLKMTLILPVATASVERAFSAMNIIKNRLRNRMNDE